MKTEEDKTYETINMETSISFAEWISYQNYEYHKKQGVWVNFTDHYTTKELYQLFISSYGTF